MMYKEIKAKFLTAEDFKPFGTVIGLPKTKPTISANVLDYWDKVADLSNEDRAASFLLCKRKPFEFTSMERHVKTTEVFIPLKGCSVFPFSPPSKLNDLKAKPDTNKIEVFIMDGTQAIIMHKGTWHVPPIPLTEEATFVIILRKGTAKEDLISTDLDKTIKISL